jgi:hypothetical protein
MKPYEPTFIENYFLGFASGYVTGILLCPIEFSKVAIQSNPNLNMRKVFFDKEKLKQMFKSTPVFALIVGGVIGVEFSINELIRKNYGPFAGIIASAFSGSAYLTAGDHLMFYRNKNISLINALKKLFNIRKTALWTGFIPMFFREGMFMTSVMYLGPFIGNFLRSKFSNSNNDINTVTWNSYGRTISGVIMSILSHPFDTLTREMQKQVHDNPDKRPDMLGCLKGLHEEHMNNNDPSKSIFKHPLFRGAIPRMIMVSIGGVFVGGFYEKFKEKLVKHRMKTN